VSAAVGATVVVALGANLGDREATIDAALADLAALPLTDDVRASRPHETIAVTTSGEDPDAPRYLNAVAVLRTRLAPSVLLAALHRIEAAHGRERRARWGDRTLDLDLVAWAGVRSASPDLTLPHPRAAERDFVLIPWLEVDADGDLPGSGAVRDLVAQLEGDR
jgi:2-amino-4-hydroxy-6-hydroxymethyldihydropteridine diphosphokinase